MFWKISAKQGNICVVAFFNSVAHLKACNFVKKRLQHSCFPVKFVKSLKTPILKNVCERLLLISFNPFVPTASFLYPLKTSENLTVFWCIQRLVLSSLLFLSIFCIFSTVLIGFKNIACPFKHPFSKILETLFPRKISSIIVSPPLIYTFPISSRETNPKKLCNFIEITLQYGCSPFSEYLFLRTPLEDCI